MNLTGNNILGNNKGFNKGLDKAIDKAIDKGIEMDIEQGNKLGIIQDIGQYNSRRGLMKVGTPNGQEWSGKIVLPLNGPSIEP
ncbi:hypothetical protein [Peribacillus asahii]|uniref:hypothetical protein n=1 Tax=Peribacillus asahii TaxID=228899 RepID=UPI0020798B56|nr:hypothetical protein [Peribacillus asahii]USK69776.1 hypothetical protein LIS76_20000 [Peribacillus asahii]